MARASKVKKKPSTWITPLPGEYQDPILNEREQTHGDYNDVAGTSQMLKTILRSDTKWEAMSVRAMESLEMICVKLARIVNGDPNNKEHWDDIAGYAKLISERLGK